MAVQTKALSCFLLVLTVLEVHSAPRSKSKNSEPSTVYDQKQTGDYNIQLHLKDFQIIAILADDSLGGLGDYDYNYDYADFTVKPAIQKPNSTNSSTEDTTQPSSTSKPDSHPYPILTPNTTSVRPTETSAPPPEEKSTEKPATLEEKSTVKPASHSSVEIIKSGNESSNNAETDGSSDLNNLNPPGQIKVQIIETPIRTNIGIVPGEELGGEVNRDNLPAGEATQYRYRCASGFARDKKGRCRKIRRPAAISPQLPFGISRFASNLAARFRQATAESSLPPTEAEEE